MTARGFAAVLQREGHAGGRRGFTVALIGCDGAGKTTVARALERATGLPVRYLYMGVSAESSNRQLPSTRVAHAIKRRAAATRRHAPAEAGRAPPPHGVHRACRAGRSALRLANRLAEEWYRQLIAQAFLTRGSIVVFDRHFLADYHAFDVAGTGRPLSRRIHGWMLMHAYPRPDLVVLLDAPPEVLFARKGEGTLASLARRREDYLGLADAAGIDRSFAVVSATQPVDAVVADVATIVCEAATGR
jgi:thymidylate kinase